MILNPVERYYTNKGRQEGYKEGFKKGFEDGFEEIRLIIAEKMIKKGFPINEIMDLTELSKKEILKNSQK